MTRFLAMALTKVPNGAFFIAENLLPKFRKQRRKDETE